MKICILFASFIICLSCSDREEVGSAPAKGHESSSLSSFIPHNLSEHVELISEENGLIAYRSWSFQTEVPFAPGLKVLRQNERIDRVIKEGKNEWEKMVILCRWAYNQWTPGQPNPYPRFNALKILSWIRTGKSGGFCAQYAIVFIQALLSLGWQGRYLDVDGSPSKGGHITVEVWSNRFNKWAVLDPFFGCYIQNRSFPGVPLSALEIHQALIEGKVTDLVKTEVGGDAEIHPPPKVELIDYFFHLAVDMRNNHLSRTLQAWNRHDTYLSWKDGHTHGKPEIYTFFTGDKSDFNFPMNQVQVSLQSVNIKDRMACMLRTNMPYAEFIKVKRNLRPDLLLPLKQEGEAEQPAFWIIPHLEQGLILLWRMKLIPGKNIISFQAVNASGVEGPPAVFEIILRPNK